jgi:hypothetical protein
MQIKATTGAKAGGCILLPLESTGFAFEFAKPGMMDERLLEWVDVSQVLLAADSHCLQLY